MQKGVLALILVLFVGVVGVVVFVGTPGTNSDVTSFDECVALGNPVMESYPRQCRHNGVTFVEDISRSDGAATLCEEDGRGLFCTADYTPVCGLVRVECITTPCNPVPETFSNACTACSNSRVISYMNGACETATP